MQLGSSTIRQGLDEYLQISYLVSPSLICRFRRIVLFLPPFLFYSFSLLSISVWFHRPLFFLNSCSVAFEEFVNRGMFVNQVVMFCVFSCVCFVKIVLIICAFDVFDILCVFCFLCLLLCVDLKCCRRSEGPLPSAGQWTLAPAKQDKNDNKNKNDNNNNNNNDDINSDK